MVATVWKEATMIDHLGFNVGDIKASRAFYDRALASLQIAVVMEVTPDQTPNGATHIGYGKTADSGDIQAGKPSFWISDGGAGGNVLHVAFVAKSQAQVDAFYEAAVAAGGTDNGRPGPRPEYHPGYYGAFVLDPDGHNIEAVWHGGRG
jgi:catechol 2,3-dioxygenase-like lactoylglutathione lyase family enzyme